MTDGCGISCKIALRWMPLVLSDYESTLVQVMAWCRQASSHYLNQCWPVFMSPNGVTRPQWFNSLLMQYPLCFTFSSDFVPNVAETNNHRHVTKPKLQRKAHSIKITMSKKMISWFQLVFSTYSVKNTNWNQDLVIAEGKFRKLPQVNVRVIYRSPVHSLTKGRHRGPLMLLCC